MVPYDLSIIFKIFSSLVMYCKEGKEKMGDIEELRQIAAIELQSLLVQ